MYATGTIKIVISGSMPGGERFAFGFQSSGSSGSLGVQTTAAAGAIAGHLTSASNALKAFMTNGCTFTDVAAYGYDGGKDAAAVSHVSISVVGTGSSGSQLPNQLAVVGSLRTGGAGASSRGRMYLPLNAVPLSNGQVVAASGDAIAAGIKTMFSVLSGASGDGLPQTVVVASGKNGTNKTVTQVIVDSRVDTQRNRAEKVAPTHVSTASIP